MATFSVGAGDYIKPWKNVPTRHYGVDSGQTILPGDPVIYSTDAGDEHLIKRAADDPVAGILGFALEGTITGYAKGDKIAVGLAVEGAEFIGRGDTVAADPVDLADIGTARSIQIDATNSIWSIDTAKADADVARIHEFRKPTTRDLITVDGDIYALIVFTVVPAARVYGSPSAT